MKKKDKCDYCDKKALYFFETANYCGNCFTTTRECERENERGVYITKIEMWIAIYVIASLFTLGIFQYILLDDATQG